MYFQNIEKNYGVLSNFHGDPGFGGSDISRGFYCLCFIVERVVDMSDDKLVLYRGMYLEFCEYLSSGEDGYHHCKDVIDKNLEKEKGCFSLKWGVYSRISAYNGG